MTLPRIRSPERDKAFEIYKNSGGTLELVRIADELGVPEGTVRGWKNKDKWEQNINGTFQKKKRNAQKKKQGAPKGNKNAAGHGAPSENKNAEKHGFFSKWLPPETLSIMQEIEEKTPADMLWDQIMIQYTAIIRAQRLMYVKDQQDLSKEITMKGEGITSWDVQQAWDKQSKFLQAQSRAMTTLNGMIKQYEEMCRNADEQKEIAEERLARIAKIKAETNRISETKAQTGGMTVSVVMSSEVAEYAE